MWNLNNAKGCLCLGLPENLSPSRYVRHARVAGNPVSIKVCQTCARVPYLTPPSLTLKPTDLGLGVLEVDVVRKVLLCDYVLPGVLKVPLDKVQTLLGQNTSVKWHLSPPHFLTPPSLPLPPFPTTFFLSPSPCVSSTHCNPLNQITHLYGRVKQPNLEITPLWTSSAT